MLVPNFTSYDDSHRSQRDLCVHFDPGLPSGNYGFDSSKHKESATPNKNIRHPQR